MHLISAIWLSRWWVIALIEWNVKNEIVKNTLFVSLGAKLTICFMTALYNVILLLAEQQMSLTNTARLDCLTSGLRHSTFNFMEERMPASSFICKCDLKLSYGLWFGEYFIELLNGRWTHSIRFDFDFVMFSHWKWWSESEFMHFRSFFQHLTLAD